MELKANELRIGNYVLIQSSKLVKEQPGSRSKLYKVENVNLQSVSKYDPIPLTEEWFNKLTSNFTKGDNKKGGLWIAFHNMHLDIYWHKEFKYYYYFTNGLQSKPILYVHRFQNFIYELSDVELILKDHD